MVYDRPSWKEIDKMRDGSGGKRAKRNRREEELKEHSTRYDKYKSDLNRLFDQGQAGELLKKMGKEVPGAAKPKENDSRRKNGRIPQANEAATNRFKLIRAVVEATEHDTLIALLNDLESRFGLTDDWEVLVRALEHPDEKLMIKAVTRMAALLQVTAKIPRRATLKERLRAVSQTAASGELRDRAAQLEDRL